MKLLLSLQKSICLEFVTRTFIFEFEAKFKKGILRKFVYTKFDRFYSIFLSFSLLLENYQK